MENGSRDTLRVGDLDLHYLTWGRENLPTVVLVHGASAHAHWWDYVAPTLAGHYRVLAPDLRGHGDSDHARPPAYAIDDYVHDLEALTTALAPSPVALVGHSLGGVIALRYTERHPARVATLAIVDSRARTGSGRTGLVNRLSALPHPVFESPEEAVRRFRLLPRGTTAHPHVLRRMALAGIRTTGEGGYTLKFDRGAFAKRAVLDLMPALAAVQCPTLLVRGGESVFVDADTLTEMGTACPHAELATIDDAHHHVVLDQPEAFAMRLLLFLGRHYVV